MALLSASRQAFRKPASAAPPDFAFQPGDFGNQSSFADFWRPWPSSVEPSPTVLRHATDLVIAQRVLLVIERTSLYLLRLWMAISPVLFPYELTRGFTGATMTRLMNGGMT